MRNFKLFLAIAVILGMCSCTLKIDSRPSETPTPTKTVNGALYTATQRSAINAAQKYVNESGTSKLQTQDLLHRVERYKLEDAKFAVNHISVDWNAQAVRAAKEQMDLSPEMTRDGLIVQLHSGNLFTMEQATYGVDHAKEQ